MKGRHQIAQASVLESSLAQKLKLFRMDLAQFPNDTVYHGIKLSHRHPQPHETLESVIVS